MPLSDILSSTLPIHREAVQHERGPRKPKLQPASQHHHIQQHIPMSLMANVSASFNYSSHLTNSQPSFAQATVMHPTTKPPPPFPPITHHTIHHALLQPTPKLDTAKMCPTYGDLASHGRASDFFSHINHLSPSPTHTIKSSPSIDPSSSEGLGSPQPAAETATVANRLASSAQNGLLDILMSSDKCQVLTSLFLFHYFTHTLRFSQCLHWIYSSVFMWPLHFPGTRPHPHLIFPRTRYCISSISETFHVVLEDLGMQKVFYGHALVQGFKKLFIISVLFFKNIILYFRGNGSHSTELVSFFTKNTLKCMQYPILEK